MDNRTSWNIYNNSVSVLQLFFSNVVLYLTVSVQVALQVAVHQILKLRITKSAICVAISAKACVLDNVNYCENQNIQFKLTKRNI